MLQDKQSAQSRVKSWHHPAFSYLNSCHWSTGNILALHANQFVYLVASELDARLSQQKTMRGLL